LQNNVTIYTRMIVKGCMSCESYLVTQCKDIMPETSHIMFFTVNLYIYYHSNLVLLFCANRKQNIITYFFISISAGNCKRTYWDVSNHAKLKSYIEVLHAKISLANIAYCI